MLDGVLRRNNHLLLNDTLDVIPVYRVVRGQNKYVKILTIGYMFDNIRPNDVYTISYTS